MQSHKPNRNHENERDIQKPQSRYPRQDEAHRYGCNIEYFDYERQTHTSRTIFLTLVPKTRLFSRWRVYSSQKASALHGTERE